MEFAHDAIFAYNLRKKRIFTFTVFGALAILAAFITYYALVLKHSDFVLIHIINTVSSHIFTNVTARSLLGLFYTSLVGGLFFVIMPIEAVFIPFLKAGYNPLAVIGIFIGGFIISYTIDYYLGSKLAKLSKKIIGPQKFYKIKGVLNKRGAWAIFTFNALPLPSQPLSTILGVFNYNKPRFYTFFILGQVTKYSVITLLYMFIW